MSTEKVTTEFKKKALLFLVEQGRVLLKPTDTTNNVRLVIGPYGCAPQDAVDDALTELHALAYKVESGWEPNPLENLAIELLLGSVQVRMPK